ncbi:MULTISPECIES: DUF4232 domain-containing protein [unclassified Streptomyces]|uniref:DUF4232 domain-containing protein n=1 Tax=unclassified Streptomyces TaxID=2593676 RepID=UPI000B179633|nr:MULTISPECIES: DUF4232 domain-containing protein [unclassified Streptomyces]
MRTARTSWRTYALGAAATAALLTSTACNPGVADPKNPTTPTTSPSAAATPSTGGTVGPSPSTSTSASATTTPSAGAGTGAGAGTVACNDNDLSITTSVWRQDSGRHLLVTATNFTDKTCTLYHYPYIGFGAVIDGPLEPTGSAPRAIATIGPKEKAYTGLFLYRGSEETVPVEAVSIGYQDRALGSNKESAMLDVALSKEIGSLNVGSNARVTYWNRDLGAIEDLLFRSGTR